ncbi:MAG: type IV pilus twitching motility protein PilT [Planctomycetota bacterium]
MAQTGGSRVSARDQLFGRLALKNKLIDDAKLEECLELVGDNGTSLGDVLLAKGYIAEAHKTAIQKRVEERLAKEKAAKAAKGGDEGKPLGKASIPPPEGAVDIKSVAAMDFSDMHGKPLGQYLKRARELGASDFHYQTDAAPFIRLHGTILHLKHPRLTAEDTERAIKELLTEEQWRTVVDKQDYDFCYEKEDHGRYRTNICRQRKGYDIIFRLIPDRVPELADLNMPDILKKFTTYRQGIVLITGPAGCGKSSTMAALVELVNKERQDHIITVEDPIEFLFESKNCNVVQRHAAEHTVSFATALRSALRADPDVIMVGEMRDLETVSMAITAAETGHLVLATLHTTNAIRSIDRIIDVFPPKEQDQIRAMVSESMRGVISQQLLPRADGLGRVPALEIMFATSAVGNLIREGKTFQLPSVLQTGKKQGMTTMDDSIKDLLRQNLITKETAIFYSENPEMFRE